MSDINTSNTNYNYINYISDSLFNSFLLSFILLVFIICIIMLTINYNNENQNSSLLIGITIIDIVAIIIFFIFTINDFKNIEENIETQEEAEIKEENEELLEENSICNVNPNLCMHGGSCQSFGPDKQQYRCNCTAGWKGNNCNTPDNITIKDNDIDERCSDKTTGEKKPNLEWCNANFDDRGGECVDKLEYQIKCPVNRDGSPNYKYNKYGCDVDNDEVWCTETSTDRIGKCVIRSTIDAGEPCAGKTISQDCLGNPDLIWDNGKQTCVPNCGRRKVYNAYENKCVSYDCHKNNTKENCSSSISYCIWDNGNKKCKIDKSRKQCQSMHKNKCNNQENCEYDYKMCYDRNPNDCKYITSKEYCIKHPHCIFNNASGCKICNDTEKNCIKNIDTAPPAPVTQPTATPVTQPTATPVTQPAAAADPVTQPAATPATPVTQPAATPATPVTQPAAPAAEKFKVGGRIKKDTFTVSSDGFVVSGYSDF